MGREIAAHKTIVSKADGFGADGADSQVESRIEMDVRARTEGGLATGSYIVTTGDLNQFIVDTDTGNCECGETSLCEHVRHVQRALEYTDLAAPNERVSGFDHTDLSEKSAIDRTASQERLANEIRDQERKTKRGAKKYEYTAEIEGFGTATGWRHAQSAAVVRDEVIAEEVSMYDEVDETLVDITVKEC